MKNIDINLIAHAISGAVILILVLWIALLYRRRKKRNAGISKITDTLSRVISELYDITR